jgi:cell division protein FtsQ
MAKTAGMPVADRMPRLGAGRRRRWRPTGRALVFAIVGAAIVAAMAWAVLGSRLLVVRSVRVVGAGRTVPTAQVLAAAHIQQGLPLIRVNTGAVAQQVERLRQVQTARVDKDWPSTIVITVWPRTAVFAVREPAGYALVDRFGVSISESAHPPAGYPLLAVGDAAASLRGSPIVQAAAQVMRELPPGIARQVRGVSATSPADVTVTLANGAQVVWGDTARATQKAKELTLLMHRHAHIYDVSGQGTAVTKG